MTFKLKPFAWSYSALTAWENCPKQYWHLRLRKDIKEAPSPAMTYGLYVHKALEDRIKKKKPLPQDLAQHEPLMKRIASASGKKTAEMSLTFNENFELTELFGRDAWLRAKLDIVFERGNSMAVWDYKTGKRKPDNEQLKLFAACVFAAFPHIEKVQTKFLWLPSKEVDTENFTRADEAGIWQDFMPRVERMRESWSTEYFPDRSSGLCRGWCPVKDCEHWEPKQ